MSYRIGKGVIRQLDITANASKTPVNITQIMDRISFYEDLFSPHLTCNVNLLDGTSLRNLLPITGGEAVKLVMGEEHDSSQDIRDLEGDFVVFKMSNKQRSNVDVEYYTLNLITPENLMDASMSVRASFHKPIHEIVQDIVTTHYKPITGKELIEVEETKGIHRFVPTGISPLAFIRQLCREAESLQNPSSIYVFYETVEGYHFVTLDGLYKKDPTARFIYDIVRDSEDSESNPRLQYNISYLQFDNSFDILGGQMSGQFNTQTFHLDPLSKTFRRTDYIYDRDFNQSKFVNKTVSTKVAEQHFAQPSATRMVMTNAHRRDVDYVKSGDPESDQTFRRRQDFMDRERAVLRQYSAVRLTASVPGNSNVYVGQTVDIVIPAASDAEDEKPQNDRLYSGKYVIAAIAHNINAAGDYATVMELLRPGFEEGNV